MPLFVEHGPDEHWAIPIYITLVPESSVPMYTYIHKIPFAIKYRHLGWCSARPRQTLDRYGIPCQDLNTGDICLPPNHPEAVKTPDLCDRFKRFEFST